MADDPMQELPYRDLLLVNVLLSWNKLKKEDLESSLSGQADQGNLSLGQILLKKSVISVADYTRAMEVVQKQMRIARESGGETEMGGAPPALSASDFGNYEIIREVGRGGFGIVFEARHSLLQRRVALKVLLAGQNVSDIDAKRFLRECQVLSALSHPNIATFYDGGEHQKYLYVAMEFVEGPTLREILKEKPSWKKLEKILEKVARALSYLHIQNIVHRDIKPENILIAADGEPKLTDFGLARKLDAKTYTASGTALGTPYYMSPEQAQGKKKVDGRSDIYSLGAIMYEAFSGRLPIRAKAMAEQFHLVVKEKPSPPSRWNNRIDRRLDAVILRALAKDPQHRYPTGDALADELCACFAQQTVPQPQGAATRRRIRRLAIGAVLLSLLLGGIFGAFRPRGDPDPARVEQKNTHSPQKSVQAPESSPKIDSSEEYGRKVAEYSRKARAENDAARKIDWEVRLARYRHEQGKIAQALEDFRNLACERIVDPEAIAPHEADIIRGLAVCSEKRGHFVTAQYWADMGKYAGRPRANEMEEGMRRLATPVIYFREAMRFGRFEDATRQISDAMDSVRGQFPDMITWFYYLKILAEIGAKNYPNAYRDLEEARAEMSRPRARTLPSLTLWLGQEVWPEFCFLEGLCHYLKGDLKGMERAISPLRNEYSKYPEPARDYYMHKLIAPLVNALEGKPNEEKWLEQKIVRYPVDFISYLITRGLININQNQDHSRAILDYSTLLCFETEANYVIHYQIGNRYLLLEDMSKAEEHLEMAYSFEKMQDICYLLGMIYYRTGRMAEAKEKLRQYLTKPSEFLEGSVEQARAVLQKIEDQ